jgi:hypothetical protein
MGGVNSVKYSRKVFVINYMIESYCAEVNIRTKFSFE